MTKLVHDHIAQLEANIRNAEDAVKAALAHKSNVEEAVQLRARLYLSDPDGSQAKALEAAELDLAAASVARDAAVATLEDARARLATAIGLESEKAEQERVVAAEQELAAAKARLADLLARIRSDDFDATVKARVDAAVASLCEIQRDCMTHAEEVSAMISAARELASEIGETIRTPEAPIGLFFVQRLQQQIAASYDSNRVHQDFKHRMIAAGWLPDADPRWLAGAW